MSEAVKPDNEPSTAGWDAITAALKSHYPSQEARHWGTLLHARIGGSGWQQIAGKKQAGAVGLTIGNS